MVFRDASEGQGGRTGVDSARYQLPTSVLPSSARDGAACGDGSVARPSHDLEAYRDAVSDVVDEVRSREGRGDHLERLVTARLREPAFTGVLDRLPGGVESVGTTLLGEAQTFRPNDGSSASDLPSLVRVHLLSQIDTLWWGEVQPYETDTDVAVSPDLVDLGPLRSLDKLDFQYRSGPDGLVGRAVDVVASRAFPKRWPRPGHLRFTRTRPEPIAFVNQLALEVAEVTPADTPPLWVTSLVRSVQHQRRLRALGFAAVLPSSHCVGYAIDIELSWFRQFDEKGALPSLLLDHQDAGEVNVINEGPAWHVCLHPAACEALARTYLTEVGPLPGNGNGTPVNGKGTPVNGNGTSPNGNGILSNGKGIQGNGKGIQGNGKEGSSGPSR